MDLNIISFVFTVISSAIGLALAFMCITPFRFNLQEYYSAMAGSLDPIVSCIFALEHILDPEEMDSGGDFAFKVRRGFARGDYNDYIDEALAAIRSNLFLEFHHDISCFRVVMQNLRHDPEWFEYPSLRVLRGDTFDNSDVEFDDYKSMMAYISAAHEPTKQLQEICRREKSKFDTFWKGNLNTLKVMRQGTRTNLHGLTLINGWLHAKCQEKSA